MKKRIKLKISKEMQLLCAMMEIEPETVLQTFADDLSIASEGMSRDDRRKMATDYLTRCGADNQLYKLEQVNIFFDELNTLLKKWPNDKSCFKAFMKKWPGIWESLRKK